MILWFQLSTWEAMEWVQETSQQCLVLKIDFDKAYDRIDWSFISELLSCLGFGARCVAMVNIILTNALTFVSVNKSLSPWIVLHWSICQGCPLAPYLYVLTMNALGYLLEVTRIARQVQSI